MASSRKAKRACQPVAPALQTLPADVLLNIALHLDLQDRLELSHACKYLLIFIRDSSSLWHHIGLNHADFISQESNNYSMHRAAFVRRYINTVRSVDVGPQRTLDEEAISTVVPLLAVLSGTGALRSLRMRPRTNPEVFAHCGLLHQLTALEVGPLVGTLRAHQLGDILGRLTQLQRLRLRFNLDRPRDASRFPHALSRLSALTHLSFGTPRPTADPGRAQNFAFNDLPAELFRRLRRLQYLQLFNCGVTSLPTGISLLTGLQTLSILSATVFPLPRLQLPPEISTCTALTSLQLSCAAIPQPMWCLPLRELTLDQTPLAAAEMQQFTRLSALQSLRLCNRQGEGERLGYYRALNDLAVSSSLTCLRLDGNSMEELPLVPALGQLLVLDVKLNRLTDVVDLPLEALTATSVLDLSFNDLDLIDHARDFARMSALRVLGLRKEPSTRWYGTEVQAVVDINSIRRQLGHSAIITECQSVAEIGPPGVGFDLDKDTCFLHTVVNSINVL